MLAGNRRARRGHRPARGGYVLTCLACLFPETPLAWKREFPVFGAVSGSVGCMAAMEAIKVLAGFGKPLFGELLTYDLRGMTFRKVKIRRDPACRVCGRDRAKELNAEVAETPRTAEKKRKEKKGVER